MLGDKQRLKAGSESRSSSASVSNADRQHLSSDEPNTADEMEPGVSPSIPGMLKRAFLPMIAALVGLGLLYQFRSIPGLQTTGNQMMVAGTVIATADSRSQGRDYVLEFPVDVKETEVLVWDYAAEDGDVIQLKADGVAVTEPLTIFNAPQTVIVPVGATIEVVGIHDGGGGITYAVNFPTIRTTIRNSTDVGLGNKYALNYPVNGSQ